MSLTSPHQKTPSASSRASAGQPSLATGLRKPRRTPLPRSDAALRRGGKELEKIHSVSIRTLVTGALLGMSMHKLRLVALPILALAVLASAGLWSNRPAASGSARADPRTTAQSTQKKEDSKETKP